MQCAECEGKHAVWLHELLKDIYGKEGQVHVVQGEASWRTPEEAWMEDEREEEEEVMFVNMGGRGRLGRRGSTGRSHNFR
jgi:hypothetical protein